MLKKVIERLRRRSSVPPVNSTETYQPTGAISADEMFARLADADYDDLYPTSGSEAAAERKPD